MKGVIPRRVILTREEEDIKRDSQLFESYRFEVARLPLIRSEPVSFNGDLEGFDWILFQSVKAVRYFLMGGQIPRRSKVAVIGERTKDYLESLGYEVSFVPKDQRAEGLVREFPEGKGERILVPRSSIGKETAVKGLRDKGYEVKDIIVYRVETRVHPPEVVRSVLSRGGFIVFASPSAVKGLFANLQRDEILSYLNRLVVVAIGKTTKEYLESEGLTADLVPSKPLMEEVAGKIHSFWHEYCTN